MKATLEFADNGDGETEFKAAAFAADAWSALWNIREALRAYRKTVGRDLTQDELALLERITDEMPAFLDEVWP